MPPLNGLLDCAAPADRYFKKDDAGTAVPIHIEGTRDALKFGIDFGRIKTEEKPGEKP